MKIELPLFLKKNVVRTVRYKIIAQITLISFIFSLTFACVSTPKQTYLKKNQLSKLKVVALNVSSSELDVKYSRETGMSAGTGAVLMTGPFLFGLLGDIIAIATEAFIESSEDSKRSEDVKKALGKTYFEKMLGNYFLEQLRKANLFEKIDYSAHNDNYKDYVDEGYDSVIRLKIEELSLKKGVYNLKLCVKVAASMVDLRGQEVIWERLEFIMNDEEYSLDDYKADEGKLFKDSLEKVLKKLAFRLSSDIIYSK
jgi:hypothetical protein